MVASGWHGNAHEAMLTSEAPRHAQQHNTCIDHDRSLSSIVLARSLARYRCAVSRTHKLIHRSLQCLRIARVFFALAMRISP